MRLFFGLELPAAAARAIDDWRQHNLPPLERPVPAKNFHITLAFLGELAESRLEALIEETELWLTRADISCNSLSLQQIGYWPRPGILWLGPEQWPQSLDTLASGLAGICSRFGGSRDPRRYQPHVTLARRCQEAPPAATSLPGWQLPYHQVTLFQSRQIRNGVEYEALGHWPLV